MNMLGSLSLSENKLICVCIWHTSSSTAKDETINLVDKFIMLMVLGHNRYPTLVSFSDCIQDLDSERWNLCLKLYTGLEFQSVFCILCLCLSSSKEVNMCLHFFVLIFTYFFFFPPNLSQRRSTHACIF